jgi:hypothetical protein
MSFMAKIAAGAATLALASGGVGIAGTLSASASAETSSCHHCDNWYTQKFGPAFILDDLYGHASAGNALILYQASSSDPAEDFVTDDLGSVGSLSGQHGHHGHYQFSPGFAQAYGSDDAIEIRYVPLGRDSNFCVGTWPGEVAQPGFKIRLEACGETNTLFVKPAADAGPNTPPPPPPAGYTSLITGTDTNYTDPLVLNYPAGRPTDLPRPWLNVEPLSTDSQHHSAHDGQLWKDKMVYGS